MTYIPFGNDLVAIPTLDTKGEIGSINVLSMRAKGMLEIVGKPFLKLKVALDGNKIDLSDFDWSRENYWLPTATFVRDEVTIRLRMVCAQEHAGWFLNVQTEGSREYLVDVGIDGEINSVVRSINESVDLPTNVNCFKSDWNDGLVWDISAAEHSLSIAFLGEDKLTIQQDNGNGKFSIGTVIGADEGGVKSSSIFMGIGYEEVAATTQAIHMQRVGADRIIKEHLEWLNARKIGLEDPKLEKLLNENLFFNRFYSVGKTLDTEETVLVTSRSPRYYVSAAYWDRDSLLWSFPALLETDLGCAREALDYVFSRQIRNVGIHSRFIDGTVLEPGFELDELVAPILALDRFIQKTGDNTILTSHAVSVGIERILNRLQEWRHPEQWLFGTFLMPTDDMTTNPYLTYNNVLVWRALNIISGWKLKKLDTLFGLSFEAAAAEVKRALWQHCVTDCRGEQEFVWSTDLSGNFDFYDEPPGSLTLLTYLGFCSESDPTYKNTLKSLYSIENEYYFGDELVTDLGCSHAKHPWILAVANSLLNGRHEIALEILKAIPMDDGIACEAVFARDGTVATGGHFATCAGFLCHALIEAKKSGRI
jgi:hypothetical protein